MDEQITLKEILETVREHLDDVYDLYQCLISATERQLELSSLIASEDSLLNSTYLSEREEAIKATDSTVRARAKSYVGSNRVKYEYEFMAIDNLIKIIISRISQVSQGMVQPQ